jgi:serpin B
MISRRALLTLLGLAPLGALSLSSCGSSGTAAASLARSDLARAAADAAAGRRAGEAVSAFTGDVYRAVSTASKGNLVCSPYSIAVALGMTAQGARGRTAQEMLTVLHADGAAGAAAALASGLNALDQALAARAGTYRRPDGSEATVELASANSLWGQRDLVWVKEFLDVLAREFGTGMRQVDYRQAPEPARLAINAWVGEQTKGRIPELLAQGTIIPDTRLALVNAVYLKAPWQEAFEKELTQSAPFTRLDGSTVEAKLMHSTLAAGHARGPGWSAVDLPYADGRLAMAVIVPDRGRFAEVAKTVDGAWLTALLGGLAPAQVQVGLPRWTTRSQLSLAQTLAAMGMPTAFTDRADFSGMTTQEKLMIDAVVHEGFIAVDEAGTEAAAATAVLMRATSAPAGPVSVIADRPFLYVIHDNADPAARTPLFIGRVLDPTA